MKWESIQIGAVTLATLAGCRPAQQPTAPTVGVVAPTVSNVSFTVTPSSPTQRIAYFYLDSGHVTSGTVNAVPTVERLLTPGAHSLWLQTEAGSGRYTITLGTVGGSSSGVVAASVAVLSNIETVPGTTVATAKGCVVTVDYTQGARVEVGFRVLGFGAGSLCQAAH